MGLGGLGGRQGVGQVFLGLAAHRLRRLGALLVAGRRPGGIIRRLGDSGPHHIRVHAGVEELLRPPRHGLYAGVGGGGAGGGCIGHSGAP